MKVLHLAYYHNKNDIRIVQKECNSLIQNGYQVYYATADCDEESENAEKLKLIPLKGTNDSVLVNYFINKELRQEYIDIIERVHPQIIHIHEYGISYLVKFIKKKYKDIKVIYDVHEDNANVCYEQDVKKYGKIMAALLVHLREYKEHQACRYADVVMPATPHIEELLAPYSKKIVTVRNYPILYYQTVDNLLEGGKNRIVCYDGDLKGERQRMEMKETGIVCYAGGLTEDRGITTLVRYSKNLKKKLYLAGPITDEYKQFLLDKYGESYNKTWVLSGMLSGEEVRQLYKESAVGVCTLRNTINSYYALPIKLFEYMEAGIPVVVSDFPIWREIVSNAECGFCVDEENPEEICDKINYLLGHPDEARQMGENGRKAVLTKYNWDVEEKKLLQVYAEL